MTAPVIVALIAALMVWVGYSHRRDLRRLCVPPTVVDPAVSASAGGFGPEWDDLIAAAAGQSHLRHTEET
jgi:hypothetical protein